MPTQFRFLLSCVCALGFLSACGPRTTLPAGGPGPPEPIDDAEMLLQRACTTCHDLSGLGAYADSWGEPEWRSMVETMIAYGAVLTPGEVDTVARHLAVNFGTEGSAEADGDPGTVEMAALLESACTTCHDLTAITASPGAFTAEEFRETVERMLLYGAPLSEDQVGPLVEYLMATYGD